MPHPGWTDFSFDGIGTRWEVSTPSPLSGAHRRRLLDTVEAYDAAWSRFRPDSLVAGAARAPGRYELPAEAAVLGPLYRTLYRLTGGAMTPLIGSSLERLGYGAGYPLRPQGPPLPAPRWEDVLDWQGTVLTTAEPVGIDVGAAGKGQLADLLSAELRACGIGEHFIDASGDLLNSGPAGRTAGRSRSRWSIPTIPAGRSASSRWARAPCAPPPPTGGPGATGSITCWTAPRAPRCGPSSPAGPWRRARWWPMRSPPPCSLSTVPAAAGVRFLLAYRLLGRARGVFSRS